MGALLLVQIHGAAASTCRTTAVAGAYHTCAILDDATVKCWGLNSKGQLGQADTETRGDGINGG
ncbi:hypothetical protein T484DRAFT_1813836 [Baffinella frigidus]|nr:hypothetical protein T484DRAFT_1813836 [Cryptophyta sp. CCMP2293]